MKLVLASLTDGESVEPATPLEARNDSPTAARRWSRGRFAEALAHSELADESRGRGVVDGGHAGSYVNRKVVRPQSRLPCVFQRTNWAVNQANGKRELKMQRGDREALAKIVYQVGSPLAKC